ncbi:hypothetical protein [Mesorhizobium sp. M8A.F.Ca.ET.057.01.1.1]|uniref:hypothetical protein n=1 Tax=Mesorhizobium sp. M8A.F.Ca.ET.057.01.1.1 TaxID=2493679 RepID=UPI001FDEE129|nr:hypothetical protein [Mesorhizobium sp. M8A.F.Ca.ET.057.01.1.1]
MSAGSSSWLPRRRASGRKALLATLMLLAAVASAFPLVWMVLSSLKTPAESMQVPPVWIPHTPSLEAYEKFRVSSMSAARCGTPL